MNSPASRAPCGNHAKIHGTNVRCKRSGTAAGLGHLGLNEAECDQAR